MSQPLVVTVPHQLGQAEARRRINDGIGKLTEQFARMGEVKTAWTGDILGFSVTTMGQAVTGSVEVGQAEVRIEVVLPGFLGMIAGSLKGRLRDQGALLLEDRSKP